MGPQVRPAGLPHGLPERVAEVGFAEVVLREEADDDAKDGKDDKNGQIDYDELLSPITRRQGTRERAITERIQSRSFFKPTLRADA